MTPFPLPATAFTLPFVAPFRGQEQRQGMIVQGPAAGEFAPFPDYTPEQDARWLVAAVEAAVDPATGPGTALPVNAVLPDVPDADLAEEALALLRRTGCTTVKMKVGGRSTGAELARVTTVQRAAGGDLRLRLDGNGRYDVAAARELLVALSWAEAPVEYVEQPCPTFAQMVQLKADSAIPLAVDETLRRDRRFGDLADAADVAIVKVAPLGGAVAVAELVGSLGLPVVVSGAAESSIGASRDAVVAAALASGDRAHGLGTGTLLAADLTADPMLPTAGAVVAARRPVDPGLLAAAESATPPTERREWQERLESAWATALAGELVPATTLAALDAVA